MKKKTVKKKDKKSKIEKNATLIQQRQEGPKLS